MKNRLAGFKQASKALAVCTALLGLIAPAFGKETRAPRFARPASLVEPTVADCEPNRLVIIPRAGADADEQNEALQEVHGHIINTISNGHFTALLVETEPGMLPAAYTKLSRDKKNFDAVQLNYYVHPNLFPTTTPNDPIFPQSWWLTTLNVPKAWALTGFPSGKGVVIGLLDTGCDANQVDLKGKILTGYNAYAGSGVGNYDTDTAASSPGHGSAVASLMVGNTNNGQLGCGIAYNAVVDPVIINAPGNHGTVFTIMNGLLWLESQKVRIVNCSYTAQPPNGLTNLSAQPAFAQAVKDFYNKYNGLFFAPAGNSGVACTNCSQSNDPAGYDPNIRTPFIITTSGFDSMLNFAPFSVLGNSLWFGGPAVNIVVTGRGGTTMTVSGTSAASPMNAAIAALCLGAKPTMTNQAILIAMANHTTAVPTQPSGSNTTISGMGIPDAYSILKSILGL